MKWFIFFFLNLIILYMSCIISYLYLLLLFILYWFVIIDAIRRIPHFCIFFFSTTFNYCFVLHWAILNVLLILRHSFYLAFLLFKYFNIYFFKIIPRLYSGNKFIKRSMLFQKHKGLKV